MSVVLINLKIPFSSKPFITLRRDSINGGMVYPEVIVLGFVRVSLININTSTVFYCSLIGSRRIHFNLWRGALVASSSVSF